MKPVTMRRKRQQGFVLAVVLWSIAALTLITGGIVARINQTLNEAYRLRQVARQEQDFMATEQTLLYLIAARSQNPAGTYLGTREQNAQPLDPFAPRRWPENQPGLRYDGRLYQGVGQAYFALQDAGARFGLLEPGRPDWQELMRLIGVDKSAGDRWLDQLLDYQDRDDLARLNGAEASRYRELGLPPPVNGFLTSPHQLRNLPFALERPAATERLIVLSTAGMGFQVNLNTSPPELLRLHYQLSEEDAERVRQSRGRQLFVTTSQASSDLGLVLGGSGLNTTWQPTGLVRLVLADAQGRQKRWIAVNFTPNADGKPWLIEYHHPVALDQRLEEPDTTDAFSSPAQTEATPPATSWALYSTFFPEQLLGREYRQAVAGLSPTAWP